jgi:hypothetical protein
MPRKITPATSIVNLRKEAKRWLSALRAQDPDARARLERVSPAPASAPAEPVLRDVQHALAREYGLESWIALKAALASAETSSPAPWSTLGAEGYEQLARDFVLAFDARDEAALARLNTHYERAFTFDDLWAEVWRRVYAFRERSSRVPKNYLHIDEARGVIAQDAGFGSWSKLTDAVTLGAPRVPPYATEDGDGGVDGEGDGKNGKSARDSRIAPRRQLNRSEWDELIAVMKERRITRLDAGGLMTDELMARVAELDHVTALSLGGSRQLSDDGLLHLARMPQLETLELSEYPGGRLTDRGLAVLAHLPKLRRLEMTWQSGITDAGVAHLRACDALEQVNLMGTPTGDGALEALQGKPCLRRISSGRLVTDAGLRHLRNYPLLQACEGASDVANDAEGDVNSKRFRNAGARLLIDGPFTDAGLASLAGLAGIVDLDLFWHVTALTSAGFAHLRELPNLAVLGADGKLSDNESMRHFAAIPRLRSLRCQEAAATDEGFEALSRSATLARLWGRVCPNFGSRGFIALSKLPSLRALGIGCANVDDAALSTLPRFPSLRELTPVGVKDDGFRHVGKCERLTRLTCMYCRETTDAATEHIAGLNNVTYYYAGLTLITDRSLEILGRMMSLEQIELYECNHVTDAGLPYLAALPRLREVHLDCLPGVTLEGTRVLPPHVRVKYTT